VVEAEKHASLVVEAVNHVSLAVEEVKHVSLVVEAANRGSLVVEVADLASLVDKYLGMNHIFFFILTIHMSVIHQVGDIIVKKISDTGYSITKTPFFEYIISLKHLTLEKDNDNDNVIVFEATSVETLKTLLDDTKNINNEFCLKMIYDLGVHILFYERNDQGIVGFNLEDIIVINEEVFLFLNQEMIFSINNENKLKIDHVFEKSEFSAPELNAITELPAETYNTSCYYSLAKIILHCLRVDLNRLKPTKLFNFLDRCLKDNPFDRIFLYI